MPTQFYSLVNLLIYQAVSWLFHINKLSSGKHMRQKLMVISQIIQESFTILHRFEDISYLIMGKMRHLKVPALCGPHPDNLYFDYIVLK